MITVQFIDYFCLLLTSSELRLHQPGGDTSAEWELCLTGRRRRSGGAGCGTGRVCAGGAGRSGAERRGLGAERRGLGAGG